MASLSLYGLRVDQNRKHRFPYCCIFYHGDVLLNVSFLATGVYVTYVTLLTVLAHMASRTGPYINA
jgi:hypothetical protein